MSWHTPRTWTVDIVTVSDMNQQIRDNMNVLKTCIFDNGHFDFGVSSQEPEDDLSGNPVQVPFQPTYDVLLISAQNVSVQVLLPFASTFKKQLVVKRTDNNLVHTVTIIPSPSLPALIDGETSYILDTQYRSVTLQSDLSNWWIL